MGVDFWGDEFRSPYDIGGFQTSEASGAGEKGEVRPEAAGAQTKEDDRKGPYFPADDIGGKDGKVLVKPAEKKECQTCKARKYKDRSDENVSFKTAAHISPESAGAKVRAHEGEHVANAYSDAAEKGGRVLSVGVSIYTDVCPECGRVFVSGGETRTAIAYPVEDDKPEIKLPETEKKEPENRPYLDRLKALQKIISVGFHYDEKVGTENTDVYRS